MYMHINAHTLSWLSTHRVRMYALILGAQEYVYELCIDPRVFGCKVIHGHTSVLGVYS